MGNLVFSNNASALLAASISDVDTTIQVDAGFGALFPAASGSQFFKMVLTDASGDFEICNCTAHTALSDLFTVSRGEEGTTAQAWTLGVTRVEIRATSETFSEFVQKSGDSMTGQLTMGGQAIDGAELTGSTVITGGQTVGTAIRGALDDTSNEILVPNDGTRATAGGATIRTSADNIMDDMPIGSIIMWATGLGSLPTGWFLCDGTSGTLDLTDNFIRGAGGSFSLGATGGASTASGTTSSSGSHSHSGGTTAGHALTTGEMPAHYHESQVAFADDPTNDESIEDQAVGNPGAGTRPQMWKTGTTGSGSAHTHGMGTTDSGGDHTHTLSSISVIPPYIAVYYVQKVS